VSRKKRDLSEEEHSLWRRVAATVNPRRPEKAKAPVVATSERRASAPKREPVKSSPARVAPKASHTPPADRGGEKRVRRGKLEIDASLDLHGHTQETGRSAVLRFIQAAHARGDRTIIVITGAGRAGQGVLKQRLPDWLAEVRPLIAGFAQAHRQHGGAGAFYVFLKRRS
jgi:DNA-nicking Smr family endonuclease